MRFTTMQMLNRFSKLKTAEKIQRIEEKLKEDKGPLAKRTKTKFPCIECKKQCRNGQDCIECETCKEWLHLKCTHLTVAQFTDIIADENIPWSCSKCNAQ